MIVVVVAVVDLAAVCRSAKLMLTLLAVMGKGMRGPTRVGVTARSAMCNAVGARAETVGTTGTTGTTGPAEAVAARVGC